MALPQTVGWQHPRAPDVTLREAMYTVGLTYDDRRPSHRPGRTRQPDVATPIRVRARARH